MAAERSSVPARHAAVYRRLLLLYPVSFRREYGAAMVQVFTDRLREDTRDRGRAASVRVRLHVLRALVSSVSNQRIEALMSEQRTTTRLTSVIMTAALAIVAIATLGRPAIALLAATAAWATYQYRHGRYVRLPRHGHWFRWIAAGAAILAVASVAILSFDLNDLLYSLWILLTTAGLCACAVGILIGVRDRLRGPAQPG
jgi:hypothetical protein